MCVCARETSENNIHSFLSLFILFTLKSAIICNVNRNKDLHCHRCKQQFKVISLPAFLHSFDAAARRSCSFFSIAIFHCNSHFGMFFGPLHSFLLFFLLGVILCSQLNAVNQADVHERECVSVIHF